MQTITGTFVKALPVTQGDSQRGHWYRGGFIIKFGEEITRHAAFTTFDTATLRQLELLAPGITVSVSYQPESREHEGRWYTELRCFSVTPINNNQQ